MILRRLSEAVRRQDWFVVVLEVAIVVVGIFIGLQVNDWNEERLERKHEGELLVRLHDEIVGNVLYFQEEAEDKLDLLQALENSIKLIVDPPTAREPSVEDLRGLSLMSRYPSISPRTAVQTEMAADGGLRVISSVIIRQKMAAYLSELSFIQKQLEYFRDGATVNYSEERLIAAGIGRSYAPEQRERSRVTFDLEKLTNTNEIRSFLLTGLRDQAIFSFYIQDVLVAASELCQTLAEQVDAGSCPDVSATMERF